MFELLPIHQYEEKIEVSDWVKENQDLGVLGEKIVKKFLKSKYGAKVIKEKDYKGYDLWVQINDEGFAVEVKTTESDLNTFFLTITEVLKAREMGQLYNIYRVLKKGNIYKIYILNDPIKILKLNTDILKNGYKNEFVEIYWKDFRITVSDDVFKRIPAFEFVDIEC